MRQASGTTTGTGDRVARLPALVLFVALLPAMAVAQQRPPPFDPVFDARVSLGGGLGYGSVDTDFRFDANDGTRGTALNAEDDLGLDSGRLLGRAEVTLRPRPRHRVRLGTYFLPLKRDATQVLAADARFGNDQYFAGETVATELDLQIGTLSYTYSVIRRERTEVGLSIGIDMIDFRAELDVAARQLNEREEESGPAPLFGAEVAHQFRGRWYGEARLQYFSVSIDESEGSILQGELNALYRYRENVLFGAGLNYFDVALESNDPGDTGTFDLTLLSPQAFIRVAF